MAGFPFDLIEEFTERLGQDKTMWPAALGGGTEPSGVHVPASRGRRESDRPSTISNTPLRQLLERDGFMEAVLLSNPAAYERLRHWSERHGSRANSASRRIERLILKYCQRFATKNESTSFFGPTCLCRCDGAGSRLAGVATGRLRRRQVFFANWAADALARAATVTISSKATEPLTELDWLLKARREKRVRPVVRELRRLCAHLAMPVPPGDKKVVLERMSNAFSGVTGMAGYRREGQLYGDRMLVREDAEYRFTGLAVGRGLASDIVESCTPALEVLVFLAETRFEGHRRVFNKWFNDVYGDDATIPLATCVADCKRHKATLDSALADAHGEWCARGERLMKWVRRAAHDKDDTETITVPRSELDELSVLTSGDAQMRWPTLFSVDVLLAASSQDAINAGGYMPVLGEVHPSLGIDGFYSLVSSRAKLGALAAQRLLDEGRGPFQPVDLILPTENKTQLTLDLEVPELELGGVSGCGRRRLEGSQVYLRSYRGRVQLRAEGYEAPLFMFRRVANRHGLRPLSFFSVPNVRSTLLRRLLIWGRAYTPRIVWGPMVVQRRTWTVALEAPGNRDCIRRAVGEQRAPRPLPRHVFCHTTENTKPLYVDTCSRDFVDVLAYECAASKATLVRFVEMLPGPDELWLKDTHGRHTSEFRLGMCRRLPKSVEQECIDAPCGLRGRRGA